MFEFFKKIFTLKKSVKFSVKNYLKRQEDYIKMTNSELQRLPEEELYDAILARVSKVVDAYENILDGISLLNKENRVFYITSYYEMEVNNGGLCQFFVNSSRMVAPFLSEALLEIGALEHKKEYDEFILKNDINVKDLSSFNSQTVEEFSSQYERYPFDDFDNAFYNAKPISEYLTDYVKINICKF